MRAICGARIYTVKLRRHLVSNEQPSECGLSVDATKPCRVDPEKIIAQRASRRVRVKRLGGKYKVFADDRAIIWTFDRAEAFRMARVVRHSIAFPVRTT
jgi:hypothetical protein